MHFDPSGILLHSDKIVTSNESPLMSPKQLENPVLLALRPLARVAQFVGLMPIGGFGQTSAYNLQARNPIYRAIIPLIVLGLLATSMILTQISEDTSEENNIGVVDRTSVLLNRAFTCILTLGSVVHFWIKAHAIETHLRKWEKRPLLSESSARRLRRLGYILTVLALCMSAGHAAAQIQIERIGEKIGTNLLHILTIIEITLESFTFIYIHFLAVLLQRALEFAFGELSDGVKDMCMAEPKDGDELNVEAVISHLRVRHEEIRRLVLSVNALMSPLLVISFMADVVALCYSLFTVVIMLKTTNVENFGILGKFWQFLLISLLRLVSVFYHCVTATFVNNEASAGLEHIYQSPLGYLTPESRFQLRLIESKMTSCKVKMTAADFAEIDHGLLVQIIGIVVTYVLVMVQFSK